MQQQLPTRQQPAATMSSLLQLYIPLTNPETEQAPDKVPLHATKIGSYQSRRWPDAPEACLLTVRAIHTKHYKSTVLHSSQPTQRGSRVHKQWDCCKEIMDRY
jgi:hypothetical protein